VFCSQAKGLKSLAKCSIHGYWITSARQYNRSNENSANFAWPHFILKLCSCTNFGTLFPTVAIDFCLFSYFQIFEIAKFVYLYSRWRRKKCKCKARHIHRHLLVAPVGAWLFHTNVYARTKWINVKHLTLWMCTMCFYECIILIKWNTEVFRLLRAYTYA
jgi:hypothetical protein